MLGGRAERHGRYKQAKPWRSSGAKAYLHREDLKDFSDCHASCVCVFNQKTWMSQFLIKYVYHPLTAWRYDMHWAEVNLLIYICTNLSQNQLTKLFSTSEFEPVEERLDCHTVVWCFLTHKLLIKSRHVADQTGPGAVVQAVTWTKCLAVLPRARWGGGIFFFFFCLELGGGQRGG